MPFISALIAQKKAAQNGATSLKNQTNYFMKTVFNYLIAISLD